MNASYSLDSCLWELTLHCNMNCLHCGSSAGQARKGELTLQECFRVADELLELGCKELTLIGGEVFLFKGWERIARYLADRQVLVNIMTNGYRIGRAGIGQILYAGLKNVGISVDGMEKIHNRIRGKADSFFQIKQAFDSLNREQIPIAAVTALSRLNLGELMDMYAFLLENDVQLWQLQLVNAMGNMAAKKDLIVKPKDIPSILEFIREKNKDRKMVLLAADSLGYYYEDSEPYIRGIRTPVSYWEGCQAGLSSVFIDSVGNVKGCGALYSDKFIESNVRDRPLAAIWNDPETFSYNRKFNPSLLTGKCHGCDVADICRGGCRASNYFAGRKVYENAFCCHFKRVSASLSGRPARNLLEPTPTI